MRPRKVLADGSIVCSSCAETKPPEEFHATRGACRSCVRAYHRRYRVENHARVRAREKRKWLRVGYGVTDSDVGDRIEAQGGGCAICREPLTRWGRVGEPGSACVDHNHTTGTLRGVLCRRCNSGLGSFRDNPEIMAAAIKYLSDTGWGDKDGPLAWRAK